INSGNHKVKLIIYDALGREIETLVNSKLKSGSHEIMFNAEYLSSGLYLARLSVGKFNKVIKLAFIK
ncbi:MAG: T9SS type A sorting domain-containing protein, partial [Bacteroidota bacterium]